MRCDWCGKFRKQVDIAGYDMPSHDRLDVEVVLVCRWCSPSDFEENTDE